MTIVVSPQASKDLREAYEFIHKDNPIAADRVLAHISWGDRDVGVGGRGGKSSVASGWQMGQDVAGSSLSNLLSSQGARAASDSRVSPGQTSD
jgi:hypothetical protein